jgi:hypothetical protein
MTPAERKSSDEMDAAYEEWLMDEPRRLREAETREEQGELGGRESGPEEWRAARDELGDVAKSGIEDGPSRPLYKGQLILQIAFAPICRPVNHTSLHARDTSAG